MIRQMCGVKLRDKLSCIELMQRLGIYHISTYKGKEALDKL